MARQAIFKVSLTKVSEETISVRYTTKDGTAKAGEDYTAQSGTLTFLAGQISKNVFISVRDALGGAVKEAFTLEISNPVKVKLGRQTGTLEIPKGPEAVVNGPLIKNGLLTNAYHQESGRGGYFHEYSGTSEGQSIGIEGAFLAYQVLNAGNEAEQKAANWYKKVGQQLLDAMGTGTPTGPMLRQPIPDDVNTITLLHWLFAARGDIPAQAINYQFSATRTGNKIVIPQYVVGNQKGGADLYRIFRIYPKTSALLFSSPYSPAFDIDNPTVDTAVVVDAEQVSSTTGSTHWTRVGDTVELTIPDGAPGDVADWFVVYGYNNVGTIKQGEAEEAYPNWTKIPDSYAACAPDTFRWFEYAMTLAMQVDDRGGKAAKWKNLRDAMRRTAVRGQNVSDLRDVFTPMVGYPVIPASGEPSGMFCFSSNPQALVPPGDVLEAGGSEGWLGYTYWSRPGGEGLTWSPSTIFDTISQPATAENGNLPNKTVSNKKLSNEADPVYQRLIRGSSQATMPKGGPNKFANYLYQLGRGINDEWRSANSYQEADQFMLVVSAGDFQFYDYASTGNQPDFAEDYTEYFISLSKAYDTSKRYVCKATKQTQINFDMRVWDDSRNMFIATVEDCVQLYTNYFYRMNAVTLDRSNFPSQQGYMKPYPTTSKTDNAVGRYLNQYNKSNLTGGMKVMYELIPIEAFQRMDAEYVYPTITKSTNNQNEGWPIHGNLPTPSAANVLPRDTRIENFGVTWSPKRAGKRSIIAMRMVSGPSKQWVLDNLETALNGSPTPFFPGAMPFAINSDTDKQRFVGFNGNPFHGYQLADFWYALAADAEAVHPNLNPATDLPVATLAGAVEYPITANTTGGAAKPKHALLAEQQLWFLKRAQEKWVADGGPSGPFAHTFVVNTPARITIGSPTPYTWVYTNDDPNTRWLGYQIRVVESLSRLAYMSRADSGWQTVVQMSFDMAMLWINRFNVLWPNLDGVDFNDPEMGAIKIYGSPTDYNPPAKGGIKTLYEEPHGPALILRACLWLKLSGKLDAGQAATVQTVGKRCWDYLELRYRQGAEDTMRYTWANHAANTDESYFGFWEFEIVATISYLLKNPTGIPTGITPALLRQRLVETQSWTEKHTE